MSFIPVPLDPSTGASSTAPSTSDAVAATANSALAATTTRTTQNPVVMELVYDKIITGLSTDVALQIHRWMKTGVYPSSELLMRKSRREVYPSLYADEAAVEEECQNYAVSRPQRKRRKGLEEQEEDAKNFYGSEYLAESAAFVAAATAEAEAEAAAKQEKGGNQDEVKGKKEEGRDTPEDVAKKEELTKKNEAEVAERSVTRGKQPPTGTHSKQPLSSRESAASSPVKPQQPVATTSSNTPPRPTFGKQPAQAPSAVTTIASPTAPKSQAHGQAPIIKATHLDIYGRAPPKEPKDMISCHICGRQVNTLRYAPHLDKCMGIGTTVRAAALAASGFVPGQAGSSSASTGAPSGGSSKK